MKRAELINKVGRAFELLGNPLRLTIFLKILSEGCDCDLDQQEGFAGNCVSSVMKDLNLPQSTVSTYLKDLADGGLIECRKKGKFLYCRPSRQGLIAMKSFVDAAVAQLRYKN
jgi:DNA-binding transcriptional ArsR family regulator